MATASELSRRISELSQSAWALSALSAAFEAGVCDALAEAHSVHELSRRCELPEEVLAPLLDVLLALEVVEREGDRYVTRLPAPTRTFLRADLRSTLLQTEALVNDAKTRRLSAGWSHTDPELIQAQGTLSLGITENMMNAVADRLEGLGPALQAPGARFLDVGAGAAGICIAMARRYPSLSVVGLEPAPVPWAEGQKNVRAAGLDARVTLRPSGIEALDEEAAYDCVYLAQMFFPQPVLEDGLPRVFRAMKPGAWLMTGAVASLAADLPGALSRLRGTLWGSGTRTGDDVVRLMRQVGFADVRVLPGPPGLTPVFARK